MRLVAPSAVVTSIAAIALAIAAPPALAKLDLNPSDRGPSQIATAHRVVHPNPDQQAPPAAAKVQPTAVRFFAANGGFDWGDAGIGAAGGIALTVLCIGGGLAVWQRRGRRSGRPAAVTS
jgi:hypothetical protein